MPAACTGRPLHLIGLWSIAQAWECRMGCWLTQVARCSDWVVKWHLPHLALRSLQETGSADYIELPQYGARGTDAASWKHAHMARFGRTGVYRRPKVSQHLIRNCAARSQGDRRMFVSCRCSSVDCTSLRFGATHREECGGPPPEDTHEAPGLVPNCLRGYESRMAGL